MKKPSGRRAQRVPKKQPKRRVIKIFCEGQVTEPSYFTILGREHRHQVTLNIAENVGTAPMSLVKAAKKEQQRNKRRRKSDGPDFDEIWCVFDTDEHPNLAQAQREARDSGVQVAQSNPCFELWLILHVEQQTAYISRHDAQRKASQQGLVDGKSLCGDNAKEQLLANVESAVNHARHLDQLHAGNGSPDGANPSSGVWRLIERVKTASA